MKTAIELYREAKACAKKHNASNEAKCIKAFFKKEIGEDRDLLLAYKTKVVSISDNETIDLFLSTVTLLVTILSIGVTITLTIDKTNKSYINGVFVLLIIILLIVVYIVRKVIKTAASYKIILTVLEDIEKEMQ